MGHEQKDQSETTSVLDVQQRFRDGPHAVCVCAVGLIVIAFIFWLISREIIGQHVMLVSTTIVITVALVILNAGFFVRLFLVDEAESRRTEVGTSLTPNTVVASELCTMSYDELVECVDEQTKEADDGEDDHA